ncbi:hypothetical protein CDL15_Pgr000932 [Punica granatum]|uniref:Berberine/berberine-like domain-containing protein n=1 Tax=Punica granatum TaxID=22663 RepID=A0A218XJI5_PUNGR|nr:hypothetical protein CDL15_Pgr000932 [Punica granatum]
MAGYPNTTGLDFLRHAMPSIKPTYFKVKSDFVWVPIPESGLLGLWKLFLEDTTYPLLLEVKSKVDPENIFGHEQSIPPEPTKRQT